MVVINKTADRYAKSLLELAKDRNELEVVNKDMVFIGETIKGNNELAVLIKSPVIHSSKKLTILKKIFEGKLSPLTEKIIEVLAQKQREDMLKELTFAFAHRYRIEKGVQQVFVTTPVALTEQERNQMTTLAQQYATGKTIELVEKTNADLIGGFVIKIGDRQIDTSVRTALHKVRQNLIDQSYTTAKY